MKRKQFSALLKSALLSFAIATTLFSTSQAQYFYDWQIPKFHSDITINEDSSLTITEEITADFTKSPHRGIYRLIPIKYKDEFGNPFSIRFDLISVTDESGSALEYKKTNEGNNVNIRIGNPNIYINEEITYQIKYQVQRALLDQTEWDELYWNVTGDEWGVPIREATATVTVPPSVPTDEIGLTCFTGSYSSTAQDCVNTAEGNTATFSATRDFNPYEGLTIGTRFPKGHITQPSTSQKLLWFLQDNFMLGLPIVAFGILYYLWFTRGRDPKNNDTVIPQYRPPKDLTPTEVGTLIDERVDSHDIGAIIIDLAVRGLLTIRESSKKQLIFFDKTEYHFKLKQPLHQIKNNATIQPHESEILDAIFKDKQEVKLSDLTNKFYAKIPAIKKKIYEDLIAKGYFPHNPETIRGAYLGTGVFVIFGSFFMFAVILEFLGIMAAISLVITGILIIAFSFIMPRKTKKGVETLRYIQGLEEYINTAEKGRIEFYEKENLVFEKLLPYAIVLGVGKKWAEAFKDIYKNPPSWYEGGSWDNFNTIYLTDRLSSLNTKMGTTFTSAPRSSASSGGSSFGGGGFSGGGFGGGGGGAW